MEIPLFVMSTLHASAHLKDKQEVAVDVNLSVIIQSFTYICSYVCIASAERRYGSTGFVHIITEHSIL